MILETDRLLLRTWTREDVADVLRVYSDPEVTRFLGTGAPDQTQEDARKRLERQIARQEKYGHTMWATIEKATGQLVGSCGLIPLEDTGEIEVGYHLGRWVWGRGYATEGARACLDHGFHRLGLDRIVAVVVPANLASVRVLEKIGMIYQGLAHHYNREVKKYALTRPAAKSADVHRPVG
jgi:ribosomal-protein-alanine N-acetyltransferase